MSVATGLFGFRGESPPLGPRPRAHHHMELELNAAEGGDAIYLIAGEIHRIRAGELVVFWAGLPHRLIGSEGEGGILHWITVPLNWAYHWQLDGAVVGGLFAGRVLRDGGREGDLAAMRDWIALIHGHADERRIAEVEIQARLLRMVRDRRWSRRSRNPRAESAVPPVEIISISSESNKRANGASPLLSDTEMRARLICKGSSGSLLRGCIDTTVLFLFIFMNQMLNYARQQLVFFPGNSFCQAFRSIPFVNLDFSLFDDGTLVIFFIDKVYGTAGDIVSVFEYSLMYFIAIISFSPISR